VSGWEPRTVYECDDAGRLIASRPEVEWDDTEVGWMDALAWWREQALCPLCGWPKSICQDPRLSVGGVEVPPPTRCHVTTAMVAAQDSYARSAGASPRGLLWQARVKSGPSGDDQT
jgi:hypothetical protein